MSGLYGLLCAELRVEELIAAREHRDIAKAGEVGFEVVKSLMTGRVVLEGTTGEHLRQELTTTDDLLGVLVIFERVFRCRQIGRAQRISSVNKPLSPCLHIVELIPEQLEPTVVIICRCGG